MKYAVMVKFEDDWMYVVDYKDTDKPQLYDTIEEARIARAVWPEDTSKVVEYTKNS